MTVKTVLKEVFPKPTEIAREAIIVMAGAALAAVAFQLMPGFKAWVAANVPTFSGPPTP